MILAAALTPVLGVLTAAAQDPSNPSFRRDSACVNAGQDTSAASRSGAGGGIASNDTLQRQRGPADTSAVTGNSSANRGNMPKDSMGVGRDSASTACGGSSPSTGKTGGVMGTTGSSTGIDNESAGRTGADTAHGVPSTPQSTSGMGGGTITTTDTTVHNPVPDNNPRPSDPHPTPDPATPTPPAPTPGGGLPGAPTTAPR